MKQNKLKLNEEKTESIVFGTRRQLKNLKIYSFLLGGDTILRSNTARNLGVIMGQYLDMSSHVSVCKVCYHRLRSIENSPVSHQRGYKNLGSCNGYFKVGLLQLITIWNKSVPHCKASKSSKCSC